MLKNVFGGAPNEESMASSSSSGASEDVPEFPMVDNSTFLFGLIDSADESKFELVESVPANEPDIAGSLTVEEPDTKELAAHKAIQPASEISRGM